MTSWYVVSESSDEAVGKVEKGDYMSNDPVTVYDARGHIVGHSEYDSSDHMWKVYDSRGNYMGRYDDWLYDTFYDAHDRPVGSTECVNDLRHKILEFSHSCQ